MPNGSTTANACILVHRHDSFKKKYQDVRLAVGGELTDEMEADLRRQLHIANSQKGASFLPSQRRKRRMEKIVVSRVRAPD